MNVLLTGGTGYIGSHTAAELIKLGHDVVMVDNLSNSSPEVIKRLKRITGHDITFHKADVRNEAALSKIFDRHKVDAVIHFAGLKAVGESVAKPLTYYQNNLDATLSLCKVMQQKGVKKLIFSSSATVYGNPQELPLKETSQTGVGITNPYGQTKYMIEQILRDLALADRSWTITTLRYFNPIGAHESGLIGEDPTGLYPNNLMPYITQVAVGRLKRLQVFGDDYDTPDGTGVRDYIHVVDLAKGHAAALEHMALGGEMIAYNLGTGSGVSVLELLKTFEQATKQEIPYDIIERRPGDVAACYADASKAKAELNWQTEKTLQEACADSWNWQSQNPHGY